MPNSLIMARLLAVFFLLSLTIGVGASPGFPVTAPAQPHGHQVAGEWHNYDCPEGRFSVTAPGTPEIVTDHNQTPLGQVDEHTYRWRRGDMEWVVEYSDVPDAALAFNGRILFVQVRRGFQRTTGQPVSNEAPWKFANYQGLSFDYQFAKSATGPRAGVARTFLAGNRLYVLTVTWDRASLPPQRDEANRFFDSLQLKS